MICKNCKEIIPDNSVFCPSCGQKAEPYVEQPPVYEETAPLPNVCTNCGSIMDPDAMFCNVCGQAQAPAEEAPAEPAPKKKKKALPLILAGIAGLLVIALIIGMCTSWFGLTGPAAQISRAAKKTLKAENFTVDFEMTYDSYYSTQTISGTASIAIDMEAKDLTLYADIDADDETGIVAIYDGFLITYSDGEYSYEDVSDEIEEIFKAYEEATGDRSWKDILGKDAYNEAKEYINFDVLDGCLSKYIKKINSKKWLEQNAGYSTSKENGVKMHSFAPDIYTFASASLPFFETVFADHDDYEDAQDALEELEDIADNVDITFAIGTKGGKLACLEAAYEMGTYEITFEATFSNIGSTTFDTNELDDLLSDAKSHTSSYYYGY